MIAYLAWFIVILGAAGAVFAMAAKIADDRPEVFGFRSFFRYARAGVRGLRRPSRPSTTDSTQVASAGPVVERRRGAGVGVDRPARMTSLDDFFAAAQVTGSAYVQAEDITGPLERAREAVRSHHLSAQLSAPVRVRTTAGGTHGAGVSVRQSNPPRARSGHLPAGADSVGSGHAENRVQHDTPAA